MTADLADQVAEVIARMEAGDHVEVHNARVRRAVRLELAGREHADA